jgi:hypothetical protein
MTHYLSPSEKQIIIDTVSMNDFVDEERLLFQINGGYSHARITPERLKIVIKDIQSSWQHQQQHQYQHQPYMMTPIQQMGGKRRNPEESNILNDTGDFCHKKMRVCHSVDFFANK